MAANTGYMDDGQYVTHSSLSIVGSPSRASVVAQDLVATSNISAAVVQTPDGSATAPTQTFGSERSLGFYRSAASQIGMSYGTLNLVGATATGILAATGILISSATTAQSASSTKIPNQGQIVFSILSLTTNGAAMYYRSGNSVFGWPSSLVVG
jgi:hypothetical protein